MLEDHFDRSPELERKLEEAGKAELLEEMRAISQLARIFTVRQRETKGLGHAIAQARDFVGDEPFAVLYGDDVILGEDPVCGQLIRAYEATGRSVVGVREVPPEDLPRYSSLKVEPMEGEGRWFRCTDMIEKPAPGQEFSRYSILGRCVLNPEIFDLLDRTPPGAGGEIQLTDAMAELARREGVVAVDFVGDRYDMGNKLGILKAAVEVGLAHPEIGEGFRAYLRELAGAL